MGLFHRMGGSIQGKLLAAFLILSLSLSLVSSVSTYLLLSRSAKTQINQSFSLLLDNAAGNIEQEIQRLDNLADFLFMSDVVKAAVQTGRHNTLEARENSYSAYNQIQQYVFSNCSTTVNSVAILGFDGYHLACDINYIGSINEWSASLEEVQAQAVSARGGIVWAGVRSRPLYPSNQNSPVIQDIELTRVLKDARYRTDIGVIHVSVNPQIFSQHIRAFFESPHAGGPDYSVCLLDKEGQVISSTDPPLATELRENIVPQPSAYQPGGLAVRELGGIAFARKIQHTGWTLVGTVRYPSLLRQNRYALAMALLSLALSLLVCWVAYVYLTRGIFSRIKGFCQVVRGIGLSDSEQRLVPSRQDEIGRLAMDVNQMLDQIARLNRQNTDKELRLKDAEYQARQSQMTPHFIYNTLHYIRTLAEVQGHTSIVGVVNSFWSISKYASDLSSHFVSVAEEIAVAQEYVRLQEYSYPGRFTFYWNVDQEAMTCRCIKFFLQPILENAIFHGVYPKGRGDIYVNIYMERGELIFNIHDNGVGMEGDKIEAVLSLHSQQEARIGLRNVIERLTGIYGEGKASVHIESEPGQYTDIVVRQPCQGEGESR